MSKGNPLLGTMHLIAFFNGLRRAIPLTCSADDVWAFGIWMIVTSG